jgi:hypothetical protein
MFLVVLFSEWTAVQSSVFLILDVTRWTHLVCTFPFQIAAHDL